MKNLKKEIIFYSRKAKDLGFLSGFSGNLSLRINSNNILITSTGKDKGNLKEKDISLINLEGKVLNGVKPSSEYKMHTFIYKNNSKAKAILHTHPPFISAFSASKVKFDKLILSEFILTLGNLPKTEYQNPQSQELAESLLPFLDSTNTIILKNHGLVAYSSSLEKSLLLTEEAEHYAKVYFYNILLGKPDPIKEKFKKELLKIKQGMNIF